MPIYHSKNCLKDRWGIIFVLLILAVPFSLAAELNPDSTGNPDYVEYETLTELQKQARVYRQRGLQMQAAGDLDGAMAMYQKATELDPQYAVAYNDLGIICEAEGKIDQAEDSYLSCVKIDPNYLGVYSNLASLYESKRELDKAAYYWERRAKLGHPDDPWTKKAKQRLGEYYLAAGKINEYDVFGLMEDVMKQKSITAVDDKALAANHFRKAKLSYDRQDYATALKEAFNAWQIDPANEEIEGFIDKVQTRILSK